MSSSNVNIDNVTTSSKFNEILSDSSLKINSEISKSENNLNSSSVIYRDLQGGDYVSSSAHTSNSESVNENTIEKTSYNETTISIGDQKMLSESINTSDIDVVTVE